MSKKPRFPFRLGCTSYVYPDALLPNVAACAPLFDDIEIVLFESGEGNLPTPAEVETLAEAAGRNGNSYTIHFPIDNKACDPDRARRERFMTSAALIVERMKALNPHAWVLHLEGAQGAGEDDRTAWEALAREASGRLLSLPGIEPEKVALENLGYPWEWNLPLIRTFGFSACLDVGHLLLSRQPLFPAFDILLPLSRVVHLHGFSKGRDHVSLELHDRAELLELLGRMRAFPQVVTLELFSEADTFGSRKLLEALWKE